MLLDIPKFTSAYPDEPKTSCIAFLMNLPKMTGLDHSKKT